MIYCFKELFEGMQNYLLFDLMSLSILAQLETAFNKEKI